MSPSIRTAIAFAPQGRRWHGEAMTDEGDHGGAYAVEWADLRVRPPMADALPVVPLIRPFGVPSPLGGEG